MHRADYPKPDPSKSEVAPNQKIRLNSDEGQLQFTFRRIYEPCRKSDPKKSEVAPNQKIRLFSDEGHLQTVFRRTMHRGRKLEPRLR